MKKIIAALSLALLSQTVLAAEWYLVGITKNVSFFVDKSSIVRNGSRVKFWTWSIRTSLTGNPAFDNNKSLQVADCKNRTYQLEEFFFFNGETLVNSGSPPKKEIYQIPPDSSIESTYQIVCSGKFTGKPEGKISVEEIQALMVEFYAENPKR